MRFGLAVPFPHRLYGEEIAAYVVPDGELSEQEVFAHCAERLDFAHQPKVVVFGDDVPYTATGKAKRLELAARLADRLEQSRDRLPPPCRSVIGSSGRLRPSRQWPP